MIESVAWRGAGKRSVTQSDAERSAWQHRYTVLILGIAVRGPVALLLVKSAYGYMHGHGAVG